jgi:hypothetical protein
MKKLTHRLALVVTLAFSAVSGCTTSTSYETPAVVQGQVTGGVLVAELALQKKPSDVAAFKSASQVAGQTLAGLNGSTALDPNSIQQLIASKLSGRDQKIVALVQSQVAIVYPLIYQKFASNNQVLISYLVAIGQGLETA